MKTNSIITEQQAVLQKVDDVMTSAVRESSKFTALDAKHNLQKYFEGSVALNSSIEQLNAHLEEYRSISSQIRPDYSDKLLNTLSNLENTVGVVERDSDGNLHCGNCVVAYKHGEEIVGKQVKLSYITLNINKMSRHKYLAFARHVDILKNAEKVEPFYKKLLSFLF